MKQTLLSAYHVGVTMLSSFMNIYIESCKKKNSKKQYYSCLLFVSEETEI